MLNLAIPVLVLPYCLEGGKEFLGHWLRPGIGTIIIIDLDL
jgi:hypothetical protein